MAIVVGTNTYISVADADAYWLARGNATWAAATDAVKEKALLEATQYIDGTYNFIGYVDDYNQTLAWPRDAAEILEGNFRGVYIEDDVIPRQVKDATCELALEALSVRLQPSEARGGGIKREKVDVVEVEYTDFAPTQTTYKFVSKLLRDVTVGSSNGLKLRRV